MSWLPTLPRVGIPTPFGKVHLPTWGPPILKPPQVDDRRRVAIKHAVGSDLASLVEKIPVVGSFLGGVSDSLQDLHFAEMKDILTPNELDSFIEVDKVVPLNTAALLITYAKD